MPRPHLTHLLIGLALWAPGLEAQTSLTIYQDGRVLVRRAVPADLARGTSEQRLALGALDPASLMSLDSTVTINRMDYDGAVDFQSTLRRALGRRLIFRSGKDTVEADLIGVDPERYRLKDGSVSFQAPGVPLFPGDLVITDPEIRLSLTASQPRKELKLAWFTGGASWQAAYQVVLGRETARVTGQAVLGSASLRATDAEIQLLAGEVSEEDARPTGIAPLRGGVAAAPRLAAEATQEKVGEFHLYTLSGRATLLPGITTTVSLFNPATARYTRTFVVQGQIPFYGGLPQSGDEDEVPVMVTYTVTRPRKTDLGDRPLPAGVVRLFQADSAGRLQLVGQSRIEHSPAGENLDLAAGQAFDLTARRVQATYTTRRDSVGAGRYRTVATADYRVNLDNAGDEPVSVDVIEARGGEWSVVSSSVPAEKLSSTRTRFRVPVPARGRATLTYRVRVIW